MDIDLMDKIKWNRTNIAEVLKVHAPRVRRCVSRKGDEKNLAMYSVYQGKLSLSYRKAFNEVPLNFKV